MLVDWGLVHSPARVRPPAATDDAPIFHGQPPIAISDHNESDLVLPLGEMGRPFLSRLHGAVAYLAKIATAGPATWAARRARRVG